MKKFEYFDLRDEAWQFLIDNNFTELPIDFKRLEQSKNYIFVEVEQTPNGSDAFILPREEYFIIYTKSSLPSPVKNFRIAHEIGHEVLKHYQLSKSEEEKEANMFAARILMPAIVLEKLNITTKEEIAEICNVSLQAAGYRLERLQMLKKRGKFLTSPLEKKVLKQFEKFINKNKR